MRPTTHLIAGGLAATALLSGTAVTASAQSTTITDKRADVVQYDGYADFEAQSGTILDKVDSIATGFDATSAKFTYGKKSLRVTIRFAKLGKGQTQVYSTIRVSGKKTSSYQMLSNGSHKKITVYNRDLTKILCTGTLTRKTGAKGTISFSIPNSCFKKPKKIKVQVGLFGYAGDVDSDAVTIYDESISSTKFKTTSMTKWLKAG